MLTRANYKYIGWSTDLHEPAPCAGPAYGYGRRTARVPPATILVRLRIARRAGTRSACAGGLFRAGPSMDAHRQLARLFGRNQLHANGAIVIAFRNRMR